MRWAYFFLILVVLSVNFFFNPLGYFEFRTWNTTFVIISLLACAYGWYLRKPVFKPWGHMETIYWIMMASILFSSVMAASFREQSFTSSFIATMQVFFSYLSFYTFMKLQVPMRLVMRFLTVICLLGVVMYVFNTMTFPNEMFGGYNEIRDGDDSRGMMRVTVPMLNGMVVMIFYGAQQWFNFKKYWWILPIGLFAVMLMLSLWRQVMVLTYLLTFLYILKCTGWKTRILTCIAVGILTFMVLPKIQLYQDLKEISEKQYERNQSEENVRIYDYRFWGNEYQANDITRIFGNGSPHIGTSLWGDEVFRLSRDEHLTRVDCGWVGFYWTYGAFATLALIYLFIKAFRAAKGKHKNFVRLSILYFALESIANAPIFNMYEIVILTLIFYLAFAPDEESANSAHFHNTMPRQLHRPGYYYSK